MAAEQSPKQGIAPDVKIQAPTRTFDFKAIEDSRPDWTDTKFKMTKTLKPNWQFGDGAANKDAKNEAVEIDPYEEGRTPWSNYKLITSAVVPRPIAVVSTVSPDGTSTNLAPMSMFQAMGHDPPVFVVGHASGVRDAKNSLTNILATGECVISVMTEDILQAGNASAIMAPYGVSEWALTGLTPAPSKHVKASRIKEAVFSVECKLLESKEFEQRSAPGKYGFVMTILEGLRFWVREDAINEERDMIDPAVSKPIGRMQGITYARITEGFQIPWASWPDSKEEFEAKGLVRPKAEGQ